MLWITVADASLGTSFWLWQFLGRLHPLIIHFPIALLVVALILEIYSWKKKDSSIQSGLSIILMLGAWSTLIAAVFGLLLKDQDEYSSNTLTLHQWTGIATFVVAVASLYFFRLSQRLNNKRLTVLYRAFLAFSVIGVTIAGHLGASLTHGSDYLTEVLPLGDAKSFSGNPDFNLASFNSDSTHQPPSANQIAALNLEVRSIFAHNCYKCHGAEKSKGQLRLDRKELIMRGGKSGIAIEAGHPEKSEMIRRLLLPREDKESMPPKGKTLSQKEIATLQLWIKKGALWPHSTDEKSVYRVAELAPRMPPLPTASSTQAWR